MRVQVTCPVCRQEIRPYEYDSISLFREIRLFHMLHSELLMPAVVTKLREQADKSAMGTLKRPLRRARIFR
jgi:hypothetical protein